MIGRTPTVQLEPEARAFVDASAAPPYLYQLGAEKGRAAFSAIQSAPVSRPTVEVEDRIISGSPAGHVSIRILRPQNAPTSLPVIVYVHGGGWVFGDSLSHDRLIRELAVGAQAAVVFPNYSRSPEVRYPTAIEECYAAAKWIAEQGSEYGLDANRLAVAGDGSGGNMATAVTLMSKERGGPSIHLQLLFCPAVDAGCDTESYRQFAEDYPLRRDEMLWYWSQYIAVPTERGEITASPLRAGIEQLRGLPPALVITAEADVLRDEGEVYAGKLRQAGVRVTATRFQAAIHGFVLLDALAGTAAARGALLLATHWLRDGFAALC